MSAVASQKERHWSRTKSLMIVHLVIWFVFSYVVHWFAPELNRMRFMDFPLGFYMAAQGSLVAFVISLFWFASRQNQIDEECGVAEDE